VHLKWTENLKLPWGPKSESPRRDPRGALRGTTLGLCLSIFATQFRVGLLTFGGGVAMIPSFRRECVQRRRWFTEEEFLEVVTTALSIPGPLAATFSMILGHRCAGVLGAISGLCGIVLPSLLLVIMVASVFQRYAAHPLAAAFLKGAGSAVVGLIAFAAFMLGKRILSGPVAVVLSASLVIAVGFFSVHPIVALLCVTIIASLIDVR